MNPDEKTKEALDPQEAREKLESIARKIGEARIERDGVQFDLEGPVQIKEVVKGGSGKVRLKLSVKAVFRDMTSRDEAGEEQDGEATQPEEVDEEERRPPGLSYKKCKKIMERSFKRIRKAVKEGAEPVSEDLTLFHDMCIVMTSYEEMGEEHYQQFMDAADGLLDAARSPDAEKVRELVEALQKMRKECHHQYK